MNWCKTGKHYFESEQKFSRICPKHKKSNIIKKGTTWQTLRFRIKLLRQKAQLET